MKDNRIAAWVAASIIGPILAAFIIAPWLPPLHAQPFFANELRLAGAVSGSAPSVTAQGVDANISLALTPKGTGTVSFAAGGVASVTDRRLFIPAITHCRADSANITVVRIAANNWALRNTVAGIATYNINCKIPIPHRTTASKGIRIDGFSVVTQIVTDVLTSHTFVDLETVTYANNTANALADYGGVVTITLPTAVQALPYVTAGALATPVFMNTSQAEINIEWQAVTTATVVYTIYGVLVSYTEALY